MATDTPADVAPSPAAGPLPPARVPAPPSWPWRRAGLFLGGAAQLITISALVGADPPPVTWASLLLAIAPAPLAAAAAFAPAVAARLAAVACAAVLVAGIGGAIGHSGLFFVPALVVVIIGGVRLWRERG